MLGGTDTFSRLGIQPWAPNLEVRVKRRLKWLRRLLVAASIERRLPLDIPLRARLRAWRQGFLSMSWSLYQLQHRDPTRYLPDLLDIDYGLRYRHQRSINDKLLFTHTMRTLGLTHPPLVAFVLRGRLLPTDGTVGSATPGQWLEAELTEQRHLVFRPVSAGGGMGVFFLERHEGQLLVNGAQQPSELVHEHIRGLDQYLVTEFVRQADYSATIHPATPNTVRALTLWDYSSGTPFIMAATHRFGRATTGPTDHFHFVNAGLSASIDLDSGRLGPGMMLSSSGELCSFDAHPDTGASITGVTVPYWEETKRQLLEVAAALPQSPYVGWDILMTDQGPCWLEANSPTGFRLMQMHGPFLTDPRARAFFAVHEMI